MKASYRTIGGPSEGNFKDRGSKFIALAFPVQNEYEVKEVLDRIRKRYHDANHHCYAWKIGTDPAIVRANDDGEPSNSAGKPILNQLEKYDLTNIIIVVVRYFGGKLLGVGGLINAYRTAAGNAIAGSRIVRRYIRNKYRVYFDYAQMNDIMSIIKEHQLEMLDQDFSLSCTFVFLVELEKEESVTGRLGQIEGCSFIKLETE